jgi:hypothetical protein
MAGPIPAGRERRTRSRWRKTSIGFGVFGPLPGRPYPLGEFVMIVTACGDRNRWWIRPKDRGRLASSPGLAKQEAWPETLEVYERREARCVGRCVTTSVASPVVV